MKNDLDNVLKHHYQQKQLSSQQMQAIENSTGRKRYCYKPLLPYFSVAIVAILLLMPALGFLSFNSSERDILTNDIIKNHTLDKPIDFMANDLDTLVSHLANSGIHLHLPELLNVDKQITGARLCSLAGQNAIQIYFNKEQQEKTSLFIAKAEGVLENPFFSREEPKAVAILTWAENGHFYALAKDSL